MEPTLVPKGKMPDVRGMGARDALYLLERKGIRVHIKGMGKVIKQSVAPGTPIRKYQQIQLQLS
jgi:cell division protein FtsI (penicillin-binding protein 3)